MGTLNEKRYASQRDEVPEEVEQESFFHRRSVLLSVFLVGLVFVIAVPTLLLSVGFTDDCNSGNSLIDNACMSLKRREEEGRVKKDRINIRPKKQPFKFVEKPSAGIGSLSETPQ